MSSILMRAKRSILYSLLLIVTTLAPITSLQPIVTADEMPCLAPSDTETGVHQPTGSDAITYTYQCEGTYAGKYTNDYFVYDPATGAKTAIFNRDYSYDCTNASWTMVNWSYSPARKLFIQARITASPTPSLPTNCPPTTLPSNPLDTTSVNNTSTSVKSDNDTKNDTSLINNPSVTSNSLGLNNTITSESGTGNTLVIGNTNGGSATSGDAQSLVNVANLLQSTSNVFGPETAIFTADINGDVNGDFMFDPGAIMNTAAANTANNNLIVHATNTNNTDAQIINKIDVGATTGNATVSKNTDAGNATSGDARAIANLMNIINSSVSSGKSFVGTVNINGNLNGDILLPQNLIDQLIASNTPIPSDLGVNLTSNSKNSGNTTAVIDNNIDSKATTGNSNVSNNTEGGSAISGKANTNVTLLNLTGSNIIGKNNILVFVNVLGTWVGMIMNAPTGTTSASLGGGITTNGLDLNNLASNFSEDNNNNANLKIINDINIHANTGDATVLSNTKAGNATSGDASTAVNILNIAGSNLNLTDWFGILFINVFGNWNGSFGANTSAGDPASSNSVSTSAASTETSTSNTTARFANFSTHNTKDIDSNDMKRTIVSNVHKPASAVLSSSTPTINNTINMRESPTTPDVTSKTNYSLPIIGLCAAAILLFIGERGGRLFNKK